MNNNNGSIWFSVGLDNRQLEKQSEQAKQKIKQIGDQMVTEGNRLDGVFNNIARGIGVAFTLGGAYKFAQEVAKVRSEFQQLEITFETMLKSKSKADKLMQEMTAFAARTPFELSDVGSGARMLLAVGESAENIIPTLKALGDVSAGLNVPLERLILNYGQVKTKGVLQGTDLKDFLVAGVPIIGELAKNLNRTEQEIKDLVSAGKIGFNEVARAFKTMSSEGGRFADLMTAQSKTINGQISNLKDNFASMLNDIGKQSEGAFSSAISGANYLVENYQKIGKIIAELVVTYGAYKAILISITALQRLNSMVLKQAIIEKRLAAAANITLSNSEAVAVARTKMLSVAKMQLTRVVRTLNATMLANPYVLVAAAIAGLGYAIYKLTQTTNGAEKALDDFNKKQEQAKEKETQRKERVEGLISAIKNETSAETQRIKAMKELQQLYPQIFKDYDIERLKLEEISKLKKQIAEQDATQQHQNTKQELQDYQKAYQYYQEFKKGTARNISGRTSEIIKSTDGLTHQNRIEYFEQTLTMLQDQFYKDELARIGSASISDENLAFLEQEVIKYEATLKAFADEKTKIKIGFGGADLDLQKADVQNIIKEYQAVIQKIKEPKISFVELEKQYNQELKQAQQERKAIEQNREKYTQGQLIEKLSEIDERIKQKKEQLQKLQGENKKTEKTFDNSAHLEQTKRLETDQIFAIEQAKIQAMEQGFSKEMALINFHHRQKLETIRRQKADQLQQLNSEKGISKEAYNLRSAVIDSTAQTQERIAQEQKQQQEQELQQKLVAQYQTYQEKITEIQQKYAQQRTALERQFTGELLQEKLKLLEQAQNNELLQLEISTQQAGTIISNLFGDLAGKTIEELNALQQEAEQVFEKLKQSGNVGAEGLKAIEDKLKSNRQLIRSMSPIFAQMGKDVKTLIDKNASAEQKNEAFNGLNENIQKSTQALAQFGEVLSSLGNDGLAQIASTLGEITGKGMNFASMLKGLGVGGPWAMGIGLGVGLLTSVIGSFQRARQQREQEEKRRRELELAHQKKLADLEHQRILQMKQFSNAFVENKLGKHLEQLKAYKNKYSEIGEKLKKLQNENVKNGGHWESRWFRRAGFLSITIWQRAWVQYYTSFKNKFGELVNEVGEINEDLLEKLDPNNDAFQNHYEWYDLVHQGNSELLKTLQEEFKKLQEVRQELKKYISETFGGLGNEFADNIISAVQKGVRAFDNFGTTVASVMKNFLKQMLVTEKVKKLFDDFNNQITNIYAKNLGADPEILFKEVKNKTIEFVNRTLKPEIEKGERITKMLFDELEKDGIKMYETTQQHAKERGFARMSQDTADELNGQFRLLTELQKQNLNATLEMVQSTKAVADDMKILQTQSAQQLRYLERIQDNTAQLQHLRADMLHLIVGMEQLTTKGIKVI